MKKALKIFIPILLTLLILCSVVWYLLVYDQIFTRDVLLSQARKQESKGNHAIAAWLYDKAYFQSSKDASVAIELAEQYKSIGNYTKAEFTLTNAISDGGSAELYIALCKTYVEQDKLLDAVSMLENVSDPAIKAQLEELRPAAPTADYVPGFYTQYISVSLDSASGILYANPNGEYPTLTDAPCTEPITLPAGETTIYALSVGENGLVSKLSIFGYTVGGVVEKVTFADSAIEASIRAMLNASEDHDIYTNDLWNIKEFSVPAEAQSLDDLAKLTYLESLTVPGIKADLSPISGLIHLKSIDLSGCNPTAADLQVIAAFSGLTSLNLSGCQLSSISSLERAQALEYLNLQDNTLRNIGVLSGMKNLKEVYLAHNALIDLKSLSGLNSLQKLDVSFNALTNLSSIGNCSALTWLNASNNDITTADGLSRLTGLTHLDVSFNALTDVAQLAQLTKLTELNISDNQLTDITALAPLVNLMVFSFANNQVTALPAWSTECALVTVDGSNNLLEALDSLKGMQQLNNVFMDYNKLTSVEPLSECPRLMQVNVYGNEIEDVSMLTDMSVVVNYTPITGLD